MEPTLVFAALTDIEGEQDGFVQFQINPPELPDAHELGSLLYHMQLSLAQALVDEGKADDPFTALSQIMKGSGDEMARMVNEQQGGTA